MIESAAPSPYSFRMTKERPSPAIPSRLRTEAARRAAAFAIGSLMAVTLGLPAYAQPAPAPATPLWPQEPSLPGRSPTSETRPAAMPAGEPQARGLVRARAQAVLSSEIAARIVAIPLAEGQRFRAGDTLVAFDCAAYEAQLAAARAAESAARHVLQQRRDLARLQAVGIAEVGLAEARLQEAEAQSALNQINTRRCFVSAPFPGAVVERRVQTAESVTAGTALIEIVDDSAFEIRVLAPSTWLAWLKPGASFRFTVEETGETMPARVEAIGARVEAASQTVLVVGRPEGAAARLVAGMSGTARFLPAGAKP